VVKNVAGFDLVRLAAGSRGALGIITSVTLRLFPLPARERTVVWSVPDPDMLSELREALMATGVPLAALEAEAEPDMSVGSRSWPVFKARRRRWTP
jgi:glycolate oxidase FAD binding subunit